MNWTNSHASKSRSARWQADSSRSQNAQLQAQTAPAMIPGPFCIFVRNA